MNSNFKRVRFIIIFLICIIPISASAYDKVTLTTHNLCPYGCYQSSKLEKNIFKGIAVDIVRCVLKKMNTPLELNVLPWARAQSYVQKNKADGFFAASKKDSRDKIAELTDTIAEQKWQWYMLKESKFSPEQADFKIKATFGGFLGSNMLSWLVANDYNVKAKPQDTEGLLKMLLHKRVDVILANNFVIDELNKKYNSKTKIKSYLHKNKPLGVYFSKAFLKDKPNFISEFNSHIKHCK